MDKFHINKCILPPRRPTKGSGGFVQELCDVTRSVREGKGADILGAIMAQNAIRLCEAQAASLERAGQ